MMTAMMMRTPTVTPTAIPIVVPTSETDKTDLLYQLLFVTLVSYTVLLTLHLTFSEIAVAAARPLQLTIGLHTMTTEYVHRAPPQKKWPTNYWR